MKNSPRVIKKKESQSRDETERMASSGVGAVVDEGSVVILTLEGQTSPLVTGSATVPSTAPSEPTARE